MVVFDHLGFGFSDKPQDISYSLVEQAEQVGGGLGSGYFRFYKWINSNKKN